MIETCSVSFPSHCFLSNGKDPHLQLQPSLRVGLCLTPWLW